MAIKKSELYSSLWSSCDELRGGMDASQYKDYVLVMLFIKYISDKYDGMPYAPVAIPKGSTFKDMVALKGTPSIGDDINKKIIGPIAEKNQLSDMSLIDCLLNMSGGSINMLYHVKKNFRIYKKGRGKMSVLTYIASDYPLIEVENPHIKMLSVNQALEMGIEVTESLLNPSLDRDKPNVILWIDDEKNFGEISIRKLYKEEIYDDINTQKKHCAYLEWEYTENRAKKLIQYIDEHLENSNEIELWNIWLGKWFEEPKPKLKTYHIHISQLTCSDIEKVFKRKNFEFDECIVVSRTKAT
ncbi:UNVERIFIED_CONTAM: Type I restriction-modification system methyltransferase subunit [Acetivibrio alkalicellulosi]